MKPYFSDKVFFEMTAEEAKRLRICVANERLNYVDIPESVWFKQVDQLYKDLTYIVEHLPF